MTQKRKRPSARSSSGRLFAVVGEGGDQVRVQLTSEGLDVGGELVPLLAGALHYYRLEPSAWKPALRELAGLGVRIVETYVPWQVHEVAPGNYDFGRVDPKKHLARFLDLAAEQRLFVFLRPGPHINAEMTYFGLPERVVNDRMLQARSPKQNPVYMGFPPVMFPVPSYASRSFLEAVDEWFGAFADVVRDRLYPNGPVVLLQVDNEAAYYFRDAPYDQDYHPDAIDRFREWVLAQYGSLDDAARTHRKPYEKLADLRPPERFDVSGDDDAGSFDDLPLHLDWAAFREDLLRDALTTMKERLERVGLAGVPMVHNLPLGELSAPISLPKLENVLDAVGLDYYHAGREHRVVRRRTLYVAGSSRFPFAPELGAGAPYWFTPLSHEDSLYTATVACAYGLRGFNIYMAVDRDRWYGAPIDASGHPRIEAHAWSLLVKGFARAELHRLRRVTKVAILVPREYLRLSRTTHLLGALSPVSTEAIGMSPVEASSEESLGFAGPIQVLWWKLVARMSDALYAHHVPFVLLDSDVSLARMREFEVIVAPTYEYVSLTRWSHLLAFADRGGHVLFGPATPHLDERMQRHTLPTPKDATSIAIDTDDDANDAIVELVRTRPELVSPYRVTAPLELTAHEDESGVRVLFVMNPTTEVQHGTLSLPDKLWVEDLLAPGSRAELVDGQSIAVPARTTRMYIVEAREDSTQADFGRAG